MDELVIEIDDPSGRRVTMTFRSAEAPEWADGEDDEDDEEDGVLDDEVFQPIRMHSEHVL